MNLSDFHNKIAKMGTPVILDFWAPWCRPCMMTKPILEKLAQEYAESVSFLPINADDSREVLQQFQVSGIPTVIALRNGKIVGRIAGLQNETAYRAVFMALVNGSEIKIPLAPFDRYLRLGAAMLLLMVSVYAGSWLLAGLGGLIAFLGVYDRCPIWARLSSLIKKTHV